MLLSVHAYPFRERFTRGGARLARLTARVWSSCARARLLFGLRSYRHRWQWSRLEGAWLPLMGRRGVRFVGSLVDTELLLADDTVVDRESVGHS